ncbi:thioredoxin [Ancylostoma caninum]|uniref:Thioredoxin n=1 Tax=Ancylostoma caninum TaxID=29170 RepID=A0A368H0M0_ANCCA|nr:thioredoxin [Ancylostoma caninum]
MRELVVLATLTQLALANDVAFMTSDNVDELLKKHQIVFVSFGADWCPYSQALRPIFEEAATTFKKNNPLADVLWVYVDCVMEGEVCTRFFISKYPTMKVFVYGDMMKNEYRSSRTVESLVSFVAGQYAGSVKEFHNSDDLSKRMDKSKRNIVAYIKREGDEYKNIYNLALLLRDYCDIWVPMLGTLQSETKTRLYFVPPDNERTTDFVGDLKNYTYLKQWITDKCIPLVREVTFENVEGLTEEGLPFLIYFRDPAKKEDEKLFTDAVIRELYDQRMSINPLLADGFKFVHPLRHLGKTTKDLPVLAIDSFVHMYLFPDISQLSRPGVLKQFVEDLHSGALHKRFHQEAEQKKVEMEKFKKEHNIDADLEDRREEQNPVEPVKTAPPESVFKELKPSEKRYSLLQKTEL